MAPGPPQEHYDISVDLPLLAKAIASEYPLATE